MHRAYHRWRSQQLDRDMELLVFGHGGPAVVVFPTSQGAFFEYEDRGMIAALADKLDGGGLRLICVSTVDSESF
jgi:esterase/lipase superfamily enzyme